MKKSLLLTSMFALGLGLVSCSSEEPYVPQTDDMDGAGQTLSFSLRMPSGEKVSYTRADGDPIHDESEWTINRLALYEYEVDADGNEKLIRIIKSDGLGNNVLDMGSSENSDGTYTVSITVPDDYMGKDYIYRFIANDETTIPTIGSAFQTLADEEGNDITGLKSLPAAVRLLPGNTANALCNNGITMSGTATYNDMEKITMAENMTCQVKMERIISRVDLLYETPNLKVTAIELRNVPTFGYLFAQNADGVAPTHELSACQTLSRNINVALPTDFLKNLKEENGEALKQFAMNKVFYLYERHNEEGNSAIVHIDYEVDYNNKTEIVIDEEGNPLKDDDGNVMTRPIYYHGTIDIPFAGKSGYIDALRNHRYTVILGDGNKPVAGSIKATITVNPWEEVELEEYLTSNDKVVTPGT